MTESQRRSSVINALMEAGMTNDEAAESAGGIMMLDAWQAPPLPAGSDARLVDSLLPAVGRQIRSARRPLLRALSLAGIAAILVCATAFAASPKLRSTVTGWFASGTTVRSPLVLGSVDFLNPKLGFVAVGNTRTHQGYLYKTTDGGDSWRLSLRFRTGGDLPNMGLLGTSLTFLNQQVGFLYTARSSSVLAHKVTHIHAVLQRTVDGGRSWTRVKLPNEPWQIDSSLSFVSRTEAWYLIGAWGSVSGQTGAALFHTSNAGRTWREVGGTFMAGGHPTIRFVNRSTGWLFSSNFTGGWAQDSVTHNGGQTWHPCRPAPEFGNAYGPWCTSPTPPARFYRPGPHASSFSYWVDVTHLDSGNFFGARGLVPVLYTLVGNGVKHVVFVNHMNQLTGSWTRATQVPLGGYQRLAVDIQSLRAWFFAGQRQIVYTLNGGRSWTHLPSPIPHNFTLGGIKSFGPKVGLIWGGSVNQNGPYSPRSVLDRTVNGGKTWTTIKLPTAFRATRQGFPLAANDPNGAALLTRRQVIEDYGWNGSIVGASLMTYGQAHLRFPGLAAETSIVVNPTRKVWVLTDYLPRPLSKPLGAGWTYVTEVGRFVEVAQGSAVIDAATGQEPDSCSGCAAVPPPKHGYSTNGKTSPLAAVYRESIYGSAWPPPSMARLCKPQRTPNAPAWCSARPGQPSIYFDGHILNGWGWKPHEKLRLSVSLFSGGPGGGNLSGKAIARFTTNARGQFALVSPRMPACDSKELVVRPRSVHMWLTQGAVTVWAPSVCP